MRILFLCLSLFAIPSVNAADYGDFKTIGKKTTAQIIWRYNPNTNTWFQVRQVPVYQPVTTNPVTKSQPQPIYQPVTQPIYQPVTRPIVQPTQRPVPASAPCTT